LNTKEPRAGKAVGAGLFQKTHNAVLVHLQDTETRGGRDSRDGSQLAMMFVELYQSDDIQIGNAIAVCEHEDVVFDVLPDSLHAPTGHRG
jgi:hypothetical protein